MNEIDERIEDKIRFVEKNLEILSRKVPESLEEYESSQDSQAICERYFEKIIEAITDAAFLLIRRGNMGVPEDEDSAFLILSNNNVIGKELALKLRTAKGMRNFIVHEYEEIDNSLVYQAISEELPSDAEEFIKCARKVIS